MKTAWGTCVANAKGNPKKFWQTVKPFMHSKKNISRDSIHLKEGESLVVNKLEVAEIFSAHFTSFLKDNDSDGHYYGNSRFTSHTHPLLCGFPVSLCKST